MAGLSRVGSDSLYLEWILLNDLMIDFHVKLPTGGSAILMQME